MRRSGARSIASLQETLRTEQLETCVMLNLKGCLDRCAQVAGWRGGTPRPPHAPDAHTSPRRRRCRLAQLGPSSSVACEGDPQSGSRKLVEIAANPGNLCRMEPTWQPWL